MRNSTPQQGASRTRYSQQVRTCGSYETSPESGNFHWEVSFTPSGAANYTPEFSARDSSYPCVGSSGAQSAHQGPPASRMERREVNILNRMRHEMSQWVLGNSRIAVSLWIEHGTALLLHSKIHYAEGYFPTLLPLWL
jgi:hypothetical protein